MGRGQHLPVGGELHGSVEADIPRIDLVSEALHPGEIWIWQPGLDAHLAPDIGRPSGIGEIARPVDEEERPTVDPHVALVGQGGEQMLHVMPIVLGRVLLGEQHLVLVPVPPARPVLVGPAEAEGKARTTRTKHLVEGTTEEPTTVEPVMIVAEARDAVGVGKVGLGFPSLGNAQVVEAKVGGQVRLIVSLEEGFGPYHVSPLREARAPPFVVLGNGMVLGQVEGKGTKERGSGWLVHGDVLAVQFFADHVEIAGKNRVLPQSLETTSRATGACLLRKGMRRASGPRNEEDVVAAVAVTDQVERAGRVPEMIRIDLGCR